MAILKIHCWVYRMILAVEGWFLLHFEPDTPKISMSGVRLVAENSPGDSRCEACGCRIWTGDRILLQEILPYNRRPFHERCVWGRKYGCE